MLMETLVAALRRRPLLAAALPFWLMRGRAALKHELARRADFDPALLPYDAAVLEELRRQRASGRTLVLATAADCLVASRIASHLGIFDAVLASDGVTNLKGEAKARALAGRFGERGFEYVGSDRFDLPSWRVSRGAVVAGAPAAIERELDALGIARRSLPREEGGARAVWRGMRVHQWAKNLLVFVPLLTAHRVLDPAALAGAIPAFFAFCFVASSVYLANDLVDLGDDRRHPVKRGRPLASGAMPIAAALVLAPALLAAGVAASLYLPPEFGALLAAYVGVNLAYSLGLKRIVLLDVFVLAGLYTLRIIAGAAAAQVPLSDWLLAFSMFLFLSLALAKRYVEVANAAARDEPRVAGRGYRPGDGAPLAMLGAASGYLAVLVFALYITSPQVAALYARPAILWLACPPLLYWISRVWLLAQRGALHEDPVLFALHDAPSYLTGAAILAAMAAAT